ncbi:MAG: hypothetical protein FWC73_08655 [Defluviitaleaceae bacterium]|nr:hypothetical protein [Defluviitaleaceae bacterium]
MNMVLTARETVVKFFKRFEVLFMPVLKFILGYFVFSRILEIGHAHSMFDTLSEAMSPSMLSLLFATLFVVMPVNLSWILIILTITIQVSASIEIAVAVFVFLLLIFLFYGRMAVKESYLILLTVLAFAFNIPYLVPIVVGLYFPLTAVIPIIIGVFITTQIPVMFDLMETPMVIDFADVEIPDLVTELPAVFTEAYSNVMERVLGSYNWVFIAMIFTMVVVVVYLVSRQAINYSKEIAIGIGCAMTIFGYILFNVATEEAVPIFGIIGWVLLCGIVAILIRLFDSVLDYRRAESVQFEDDDNYYHVKIVPKVIMSKPKREKNDMEHTMAPTRPRPDIERTDMGRTMVPPRPRPDAERADMERTMVPTRPRPDAERTDMERTMVPPRPRPDAERADMERTMVPTRPRPDAERTDMERTMVRPRPEAERRDIEHTMVPPRPRPEAERTDMEHTMARPRPEARPPELEE